MADKPDEFIKKTMVSAFYVTFGLIAFLFLVLAKLELLTGILFLAIPILYILAFVYLMKLPDMTISSQAKQVNKEIVFACRFLIIELESGVPVYNSLVNVSKNFQDVGKYFKEITDKIDLGTSMEDAINEAVEFFPSNGLRKILWQIVNSIRTGANVAQSLHTVVEQITKDQMNEVNKYGKKLNPIAMFYMIIAVIMPSLGMTMLIIISSFINLELSLTILLFFVGMLGFIQFMFIAMVKFSRPAIEF
jgi:archaeal flagellar protein FlaJ